MLMEINWLAIVLSTVVYMVIGSIWYSPLLFAKPWMKLLGNKGKGDMSKMPLLLLASVISGALMSYVLSVIIGSIHPMGAMSGALAGFWVWSGFIATYGLVNTLYASKPIQLFLIDTGYYLVSLVLMGAIIAAMR